MVALAGFGLDSLIEILASLVVIWQLHDLGAVERERRALRIIGAAFLLLAAYILAQSVYVLVTAAHPRPSLAGIVWLVLTAAAMLALVTAKGRELSSYACPSVHAPDSTAARYAAGGTDDSEITPDVLAEHEFAANRERPR